MHHHPDLFHLCRCLKNTSTLASYESIKRKKILQRKKWRFYFKALALAPLPRLPCLCVCSYWKMAIYFVLCSVRLFSFVWYKCFLFISPSPGLMERAKWKLKGSIYIASCTHVHEPATKALVDKFLLCGFPRKLGYEEKKNRRWHK